jgi:hypothetical protein
MGEPHNEETIFPRSRNKEIESPIAETKRNSGKGAARRTSKVKIGQSLGLREIPQIPALKQIWGGSVLR